MNKDTIAESISRMERIAVFEEKVVLSPLDFHENITSFDQLLLKKLKTQLEGRCSKHGFVIPDSLQILSRSLGYAEKGRFTSDFLYQCKAQGRVLYPPEGFRLQGEVLRKNKMGIYVVVQNAISIMIPRDLHIGSEEFDGVEIGDKIEIEIKKSRFQVNDRQILSIGQFISKIKPNNPLTQEAAIAPLSTTTQEEEQEEEEEEDQEEEEEEENSAAAASDEEEEEEKEEE